jgi:hypothetical protein
MPELIADLNDARKRTAIARRINDLRGVYRIEVTRYRPRRSDRQNRYMWPCMVQPFAQFLRDQGEEYTDQQAHELLKAKFLRKTVEIKGERLDVVGSTTELDTSQFNEYLDKVAAWLADMFDIIVPEPSEYRETG